MRILEGGLGFLPAALLCTVILGACRGPQPGSVVDEAMTAGLTAKDLPGSDDDYLRAMDRGLDSEAVHKALPFLSKEEAWKAYNRGRNNWVVWTAGNDTLWDFLANNTFGAFDLLKIVSSHPGIRYCGNKNPVYGYGEGGKGGYAKGEQSGYAKDQQSGYEKDKQSGYAKDKSSPAPYPPGYYAYDEDDECKGEDRQFYEVSRQNRWKYLGLVNEPGFQQWDLKGCDWKNDKKTDAEPYGKCGDPNRLGLWLDKRVGSPEPFEDEKKYPGVKVGARGKTVPLGSYYGYASGVVGLRLFPNPAFDEAAKKKWDPVRYYNDPDYYNDKNLVRPYRVGMSCGFCHVGPSPIDPPKDPENPEWKNLNSNPGAQYFWLDRIFFWNPYKRHENFIYQLFHTSLPGSLDTSLVSSDNINNPRTMNAVYSIAARLKMAEFHPEKLTGGELNNKQFNDYDRTKVLSKFFTPPDTVLTAHVLKDGADSVGILGALNRVYLNIGLFSEEWLLHFKPDRESPRKKDHADRDRRVGENLYVLERQRGADSRRGAVFPRGRPARLLERRAGRQDASRHGSKQAQSRQDRFRRDLRALPLGQATAGAARNRLRKVRRARLPGLLEPLLGLDQDRSVQEADARDRHALRLPGGQFPFHRAARSGHLARHQRVQPARDQWYPQQHLGQLYLHDLQGPDGRRQVHGA